MRMVQETLCWRLVDGLYMGAIGITKGEKYLEEAINLAVKNKKMGNLKTASLKHVEILEELSLKTTGEANKIILESQKKTVENIKLLNE